MLKSFKKTSILIALVLILFVCAYKYIFSFRGLTLVANNSVIVYASENDATTWPHVEGIAVLSKDQKLPILACIDIKSYLVYKVNLPDGRTGYILDGDYDLLKDDKKTDCFK
jgi:hypothetical protein